MKNIFYALACFLVLLSSSCKDPCKDVNCNDGVCLEGTCLCDDGFEGVNCDKRESDKFVGTWTGPLDCGAIGENEGTLIVEQDPNSPANLLISLDFPLLDLDPLEGTVSGDIFFVSSSTQSIDFNGTDIDVTIGGDGKFNEDGTVDAKITIAVPLLGNSECIGVLVKQ